MRVRCQDALLGFWGVIPSGCKTETALHECKLARRGCSEGSMRKTGFISTLGILKLVRNQAAVLAAKRMLHLQL